MTTDWVKSPLKRLVRINSATLSEDTPADQLIRYVDISNVQDGRISAPEELLFGAAPSRARRVVVKDDVIISTVRTYLRAVALVEDAERLIVSTGFAVLRPKPGINSRFLWYALQSEPFVADVMRHSEGVSYPAIPPECFGGLKIPIPRERQQQEIAHFLDCGTAKLDVLLAKKRRVKELLAEESASIVERLLQQATTRGPVKHVGSDWFPCIPAHWSWLRLREVADSIQTGPFGTQLHSSDYVAGGIPVINPINMVAGELIPDPKCSVDEATATRLSTHALRHGDIVIARRGEMGRVAVVAASQDGWLCGTGSMRMRISKNASPEFVARVLATRGCREWLAQHSVGSTMQNLNPTIVGAVSIPVPPIAEQQLILEELEAKERKSRELQREVERAEMILLEYRSTLITGAVTGQIDVSHAISRSTSDAS